MIRLVPLLTALAVWGALQAMVTSRIGLWGAGVGVPVLLLLVIRLLTALRLRDALLWHVALAPALLFFATTIFVLFVEWRMVQIAALITSLLLWFYCEQLFRFFRQPERYHAYSLENGSLSISIVAIFLSMTGFFSLHVFLSVRAWIVTSAAGLMIAGILYQTLWAHKVDSGLRFRFALALGIMGAECFWALHFFPTSTFVNGLVIAALFFAAMNVTRLSITNQLDRRTTFRYVGLGLAVAVVALSTAQWL